MNERTDQLSVISIEDVLFKVACRGSFFGSNFIDLFSSPKYISQLSSAVRKNAKEVKEWWEFHINLNFTLKTAAAH
jgi:hypothetical protein